MADDDPITQRFNQIDKLHQQTPAAASPATTSVIASPMAAPAGAAPAPATDGAFMPPAWIRDPALAAVAGMYGTGADVMRNVTAPFGGATPNPLDPETQRIAAAHPYARAAGGTLAGMAVATPVIAMTPEIGGAVGTGALTGAATNILTGSPSQPWWERAGIGAGLGAGFSALGSRVGSYVGLGGGALDPEIAAAGQRMKQAGATVNMANLPESTAQTGAIPTAAQQQQINQISSQLFDRNVSNYRDATFMGDTKNQLGTDVANSWAAGKVNYTGSPLEAEINRIGSEYSDNPRVQNIIKDIQGAVDPATGQISGANLGDLVKTGSRLDRATDSPVGDVFEPARDMERALKQGFDASSPPGVAAANRDAREKYLLFKAVSDNAKQTGGGIGNINPANFYTTLKSYLPDIDTLGAGTGRLDQAANFARDSLQLYGGKAAGAAPPPPPGLWRRIAPELGIAGAPGLAQGIISGNIASPENWLSPAGLAGLGLAGVDIGGQWLGQQIRQSPRYVNMLMNRGGAPIPNPLVSPWATQTGVQAFPERRS